MNCMFPRVFILVPLIQSEVVVVNNHQERDSVTLRYTPTPASSSRFDLYRFSLSEPGIPVIEKPANDSDKKVTFRGLIPGKLYNITVWTVSDGVFSQPIQRQDRLCKLNVLIHIILNQSNIFFFIVFINFLITNNNDHQIMEKTCLKFQVTVHTR